MAAVVMVPPPPQRGWNTRSYELPGASEDRRQEPREGMRAEGPAIKASHFIYIEMHNVSPQMRAIANRMRPCTHTHTHTHGRNPRELTKRMNALFSRSHAALCALLHKIEEPSRLPAWKQHWRSDRMVCLHRALCLNSRRALLKLGMLDPDLIDFSRSGLAAGALFYGFPLQQAFFFFMQSP